MARPASRRTATAAPPWGGRGSDHPVRLFAYWIVSVAIMDEVCTSHQMK